LPLQIATPEHAPLPGPSLAGLHVLIVAPGEQLTPILPAYCRAAGAHVTQVDTLAQANQQLQMQPSPPISVVLLSLTLTAQTPPLAVPAGVGVVRLILRGGDIFDHEITVPARPLMYHDLIQGLAIASGRLSPISQSSFNEPLRLPKQTAPSIEEARARQQLILLAEDNETNRDVMQAQLALLGYAAEMAEDGAQALQMWRSGRYALLLTDCHMPTMDGFELTQAIRQAEPEGTHLPIIAITANAMQGEAQRCRARGMDDYLSKPLRLKELGPMLSKWLPLRPAAMDCAPAAPLATWDETTLTQLVGDNPVLQQRLLEKFIIHAQTQVSAIIAAAAAGELITTAGVAHTLKSAARSVGALQLGGLCQAIETAAQAGDQSGCSALAHNLAPAFTQARDAIQQGLSQHNEEISR
jgi:CheY-like chemotaxis protein